MSPAVKPMLLGKLAGPFDDSDFLFELKYDGFRALAAIEKGNCVIWSKSGRPLAGFGETAGVLASLFGNRSVIVDGELACLDGAGRPHFTDLLRRKRPPTFVAFDLLGLDGEDLRGVPLLERKERLRSLLSGVGSPVLFADYIRGRGIDLFDSVCAMDLEGIVAKRANGIYSAGRDATTWFKIRNRAYSQMRGRAQQFGQRRRDESRLPSPWHSCVAACAAAAPLL